MAIESQFNRNSVESNAVVVIANAQLFPPQNMSAWKKIIEFVSETLTYLLRNSVDIITPAKYRFRLGQSHSYPILAVFIKHIS